MDIFKKTTGSENSSPGGGSGASTVDLNEIKAKVKASRGGRPPKPITEEEEQKKALDELYASENWGEISALYFNARYAITGWEGFRLKDNEKKILATSLSTMMRTLLAIDPRYIAVILFSVNFGSMITSKELTYQAIEAKKLEEAEKRSPKPGVMN